MASKSSKKVSQKVISKETPPRATGGKFASAKRIEVEIEQPKTVPDKTNFKGPYVATFYGKPIRKYYFERAWYFSLEDITLVAYVNSDDPTVRKGDPDKLAEGKSKYSIKIDGVEVAKAKDLVTFIPYFKGNMPGPITDWLLAVSEKPAPSTNPQPPPEPSV